MYICALVCLYVCVYVCEREREIERERDIKNEERQKVYFEPSVQSNDWLHCE
jgi:hypothetical protein